MARESQRIYAVSIASNGETLFRIKLRILHTTRHTAYLLMTNRKLGLTFITIVGLSIGVIFLILNLITGGQFYLQTITYNIQEYYPRALISYQRALFMLHPISLSLAMVSIWLAWKGHNLKQLPIMFFVCAWLMTLTIGRAGATINYFLEFIAQP